MSEERLTPGQLSAEHVWDYRLYLARSHKSPTGRYLTKRSQNFYLIALRAFLHPLGAAFLRCSTLASLAWPCLLLLFASSSRRLAI